MTDYAALIEAECDELKKMLVDKNKSYGASAFSPVRIMSKADPIEQILVRIDDKLSRLSKGSASGEDTELDLLGYLVILRVARKALKQPLAGGAWRGEPKENRYGIKLGFRNTVSDFLYERGSVSAAPFVGSLEEASSLAARRNAGTFGPGTSEPLDGYYACQFEGA